MKKILLYIFFFFIFACQSPSAKKTYKLSDDQLAHVLFDIHFADVMLPSLTMTQQDSIKKVYWKRMSETYDLSENEIREEIKKLESEPEKMKIIVDIVKVMADSIQ